MADETPATTPASPASAQSGTDSEAAEELRNPLRNALTESADVGLRDDLSGVQSSGTRAAQLSGEHFARLLYGPGADVHIAPYGVPPVPNSLDSREK